MEIMQRIYALESILAMLKSILAHLRLIAILAGPKGKVIFQTDM